MELCLLEMEGNTHNTNFIISFIPPQSLLPVAMEQSAIRAVSSGAALVNIGSGCSQN